MKQTKNSFKVLVLVDCQVDFIDGSLANKDAQACIPAIVEKIKNFDGDAIFLTMDTHTEGYLNTPEGEKLPVKHCVFGTHGWYINEEVSKAIEEKRDADMDVEYIIKHTFASVATDVPSAKTLIEHVLDLEVGYTQPVPMEIEICGFISDICVLHNAIALKGFTYDFAEITVDSKCCAGSTPENHKKAMDLLRIGQINVI